jgi:hypothetical protein
VNPTFCSTLSTSFHHHLLASSKFSKNVFNKLAIFLSLPVKTASVCEDLFSDFMGIKNYVGVLEIIRWGETVFSGRFSQVSLVERKEK